MTCSHVDDVRNLRNSFRSHRSAVDKEIEVLERTPWENLELVLVEEVEEEVDHLDLLLLPSRGSSLDLLELREPCSRLPS